MTYSHHRLDLYARLDERRSEIIAAYPRQFTPFEMSPILGFEWPVGWHGLIYEVCDAVERRFPGEVHWVQINEKFAELRMRFGEHHDMRSIYALVKPMTSRSLTICASCSAPGHLYDCGGWQMTLCPKCAAIANAREIIKNDGN